MRKRSFPPVVSPDTRLLVLGSLPGEASLKAGRYYAHPRNLFWSLMGEVLEVDLVQLDYEDRLATLLKNGVGLWDVVAEAVRPGSMDSAITGAVENDLLGLVNGLPNLKAVAFNGAASAKVGMRQLEPVAAHIVLTRMPSTSPAYAGREGLKREAWVALRSYL